VSASSYGTDAGNRAPSLVDEELRIWKEGDCRRKRGRRPLERRGIICLHPQNQGRHSTHELMTLGSAMEGKENKGTNQYRELGSHWNSFVQQSRKKICRKSSGGGPKKKVMEEADTVDGARRAWKRGSGEGIRV